MVQSDADTITGDLAAGHGDAATVIQIHRVSAVITGNAGKSADRAAGHEKAAVLGGCAVVTQHDAVCSVCIISCKGNFPAGLAESPGENIHCPDNSVCLDGAAFHIKDSIFFIHFDTGIV